MASYKRNGYLRNGGMLPRTRGAKTRRPTKLPPQLLREYGARGAPRNFHWLRWVLGAVFALALLVPAAALAGSGMYYARTTAELQPRVAKLATYQPFATSRIYARDGTLLAEYVREGRRDAVHLDHVSPLIVDATVAIEDKNFWTNPGVDYAGIVRSTVLNAQAQNTVSGASTITQQLVKNVLLTDEERQQGYQRKMKEAVIAQQLTQAYSKDKILELYLNDNNYGDRNYGIQAAAQGFFGVDAKDVNVNQAALLAGLPQSPTDYNPRNFVDDKNVLRGVQLRPGWLNPSRPLPNGITKPRARQIDVLRAMVTNNVIKEREARDVAAQDLQLVPQREIANLQLKQQAPHFIDFVQEQLENDPELGPILKDQGGLAITTTIDLRINNVVQEEVRKGIDVLRNRNANNAAVVVQQPGTGQILAMVGSVDYNTSTPTTTPGSEGNVVDGQVNVATRERQPGSALKPFVYLTSLIDGRATPGSIYWDVDTRFAQLAGANDANINSCVPEGMYWYCPKNYDRQWHGPLRMRDALANSLNIPAVLAMKANGVSRTINMLHEAGITGLQRTDYGLALSLGGGEVKLLDLNTAYTTLANDGNYIAPTPILKITDRDGKVLRDAKPKPQRRFDAAKVAIIRNIMDDDAARTPIFGFRNNLVLSRPSPVKTGTTNDYRDGWAMGFTPYVSVGVWTGNNNNEPINSAGGVDTGGLIWNHIMERLFATKELDNFLRDNGRIPLDFPDLKTYGLEQAGVCSLGTAFGQRPTEWFTKDMLKTQLGTTSCDLYTTTTAVQTADASLCLPRPGVDYGNALTTSRVWNVPKPTDDMRIVGSYGGGSGGSSSGKGTATAPQTVCPPDVALARPSASPQPSASAAPTTPRTSPAPDQPKSSTAPVPQPSTAPTPQPSTAPVPQPSTAPTPQPSTAPVPQPSTAPTPQPSTAPVPKPSTAPVPKPSTAPKPSAPPAPPSPPAQP